MDETGSPELRALLVDPALFTPPYDLALTRGLNHAGVETRWVSRPLRRGEAPDIPLEMVETLYYRGVQDTAKGRGAIWKLRKAASHLLGGLRLLGHARRRRYDIVHFQWFPVPSYDSWIMRRLSKRTPVVLTVHDLEPFNGDPTSSLQMIGLDKVFTAAARLIVHTDAAKQMLVDRGVEAARVAVIPHGPLSLAGLAPQDRPPRPAGAPWRIVLFGKLQPYKGLDLLIEAVGKLEPADRSRLHIVVAGEPVMPMEPLRARIAELGLGETVELRLQRLDEAEMADLFAEADAFVFPYRHIQASGVLYLVGPYRRWLIASDVGVFSDVIADGETGTLIPVGSTDALAAALVQSIGREPAAGRAPPLIGWDEIGRRTRRLYESAIAAPRSLRP